MSCELLQYRFTVEGFVADMAHDGPAALAMSPGKYSLLLIDLMDNSEMNGFQFVSRLRRNPETYNTPYIFISRKASEDDIVTGLDTGADDFISKPFSTRELIARVRSVLRRRKMMAKRRMSNEVRFEGLLLDIGTGLVSIDGAAVKLTRIEFLILGLLLRHRGHFFTRTDIRNEVWDTDIDSSSDKGNQRAVDTNISRLRKKIGDYGSHIINRQGHGYAFIE